MSCATDRSANFAGRLADGAGVINDEGFADPPSIWLGPRKIMA